MESPSMADRRATTRISLTIMVAILSVFLLNGCETTSHTQQGEVLGGVLGGVLGAQVGEGRGKTAAIIIGTIAGAMIGRHVGESMDETDRMQTAIVLNNAHTGESRSWVNPDTGHHYTVTPTRTYTRRSGPCREFQLNATIGDKSNPDVYGTACLQNDGSWLMR